MSTTTSTIKDNSSRLTANKKKITILQGKRNETLKSLKTYDEKIEKEKKNGLKNLIDNKSKAVRDEVVVTKTFASAINTLFERQNRITITTESDRRKAIESQQWTVVDNYSEEKPMQENTDVTFELARFVFRKKRINNNKTTKQGSLIVAIRGNLPITEEFSVANLKLPCSDYGHVFLDSMEYLLPRDGSVVHENFYLSDHDQANVTEKLQFCPMRVMVHSKYTPGDAEEIPQEESDRYQWESSVDVPHESKGLSLELLDDVFQFLTNIPKVSWENATVIQKRITLETFLGYLKTILIDTTEKVHMEQENADVIPTHVIADYLNILNVYTNMGQQQEINDDGKRPREN